MKNLKNLSGLFLLLFSVTSYALDFAAQVSYELSETSPADIVSADFNNDGNSDMAVAMSGEAGGVGNVSILLGDGAGAFPNHNGLAVIVGVDGLGYTPLGLGSGDFNGDGNLELIVTAGDTGAYDAHIYYGDGTGQFSYMTTLQSGGESPGAVTTADFNGDGNLDFAVANSRGSGAGVSVFMGDGVGDFSLAQNISDTVTIAAKDIVASDFDHDGDVDIAIPQMVLLNNGSGVFSRSVGIGVTNPRAMALGDMNLDGWVDAIILGSAEVVIWMNNGNGTFSATHQYIETRDFTPGLRGLAVADFDLDSQLDVVFGDELNDEARILTGNGNGSLNAIPLSFSVGNEPKNVVSDDWNADGYPDVGAVYRNGGDTPAVSILLQQPPDAQPAAGQLQFSADGYSVNEGSVAAVIAVNRTGGSYGAVSVNYISSDGSASEGSDYTFVSGALHFSSGVSTQTITVPLLDDAMIEGNETLMLTLSNPLGTTLLAPTSAELVIIDNDTVSVSSGSGGGSLYLMPLLWLLVLYRRKALCACDH